MVTVRRSGTSHALEEAKKNEVELRDGAYWISELEVLEKQQRRQERSRRGPGQSTHIAACATP